MPIGRPKREPVVVWPLGDLPYLACLNIDKTDARFMGPCNVVDSNACESGKIAMAQGTTAGLSIVKHAGKESNTIDQKLQQAVQHVRTVRRQAAIQFNPEINNGRSKMNELWERLYSNDSTGKTPKQIV